MELTKKAWRFIWMLSMSIRSLETLEFWLLLLDPDSIKDETFDQGMQYRAGSVSQNVDKAMGECREIKDKMLYRSKEMRDWIPY